MADFRKSFLTKKNPQQGSALLIVIILSFVLIVVGMISTSMVGRTRNTVYQKEYQLLKSALSQSISRRMENSFICADVLPLSQVNFKNPVHVSQLHATTASAGLPVELDFTQNGDAPELGKLAAGTTLGNYRVKVNAIHLYKGRTFNLIPNRYEQMTLSLNVSKVNDAFYTAGEELEILTFAALADGPSGKISACYAGESVSILRCAEKGLIYFPVTNATYSAQLDADGDQCVPFSTVGINVPPNVVVIPPFVDNPLMVPPPLPPPPPPLPPSPIVQYPTYTYDPATYNPNVGGYNVQQDTGPADKQNVTTTKPKVVSCTTGSFCDVAGTLTNWQCSCGVPIGTGWVVSGTCFHQATTTTCTSGSTSGASSPVTSTAPVGSGTVTTNPVPKAPLPPNQDLMSSSAASTVQYQYIQPQPILK